MTHEPADAQDSADLLGAVLAACIEAVDHGEAAEMVVARYPDYAAELREFFAAQEHAQRLAAPLQSMLQAAQTVNTADAGSRLPNPLGDFLLLRELGRGGMGIVYEARQRSPNRVVALKLICSASWATQADLRRFRNEAELMAGLDHPHIIPVYEVGEYESRPYFSMKFMEGGSLAQHLPRFAEDPPAAAGLLVKVARAVHHAHERGILHRDLKPGNILFDESGRPYVTDFGLAKRLAEEGSLTGSGALVGTPGYMAPEQAWGQRGAGTTATDVYGLGAILYTLLTGAAPFHGGTPLETLTLVKESEPEAPSGINGRVDRDLETICLKCLEKEAGRRYGSAEAVALELERWLLGKPIEARPVRRVERSWRWCRRNPLLAALAAALFLIVALATAGLGISTVLIWRSRADTEAALVRAKRREADLRLQLYVADMRQGLQSLAEGQIEALPGLLERHMPQEGQEDLRAFEWHYLWHVCHFPRLVLRGHTDEICYAAFSPDGKRIATASQDKTVGLWDAATGDRLGTLKGHARDVNWVSFSPDGKTAVTASDDGTVKLWDMGTHKALATQYGGGGRLVAALFSPDGKLVAFAGDQGRLMLWDPSTRKEVGRFQVVAGRVESLAFSPDGSSIAVAGLSGEVTTWDVRTRKLRLRFPLPTPIEVYCVAFDPAGDTLVAGCGDGQVRVWETGTGKLRATLPGHSGDVQSVAYPPRIPGKRTYLASAGDDKTIRIRDDGSLATQYVCVHTGGLWCVTFSPDAQRIVAASRDHTATIWEVADLPDHASLGWMDKGPLRVQASADERHLGILCQGYGLYIQSTPFTGGRWHTEMAEVRATGMALSPNGGVVALMDQVTGALQLWNLDTRQLEKKLAGVPARVCEMSFSPDGKSLLISNTENGEVNLLDVETGRCLRSLPRMKPARTSIAISPNGKIAALGTPTRAPILWDLETGATRAPEDVNSSFSVTFSPNGRFLLSGNSDCTFHVYETSSLEVAAVLRSSGKVPSAAFSPDGKTLAVTSNTTKRIRLWNVPTWQELGSLSSYDQTLGGLAFLNGGKALAVTVGVPGRNKWEVFLWGERAPTSGTKRNETGQEVKQ